jgi:prepilin-type N-terminal cleavage/methylation domain-containing protein
MPKKAFSILEILVVLTVLAILIGIAIPRISGMQQQGNLAKVRAELKTLKAAIESYNTFSNHHGYPPSSTILQASYLVNASPQIISNILYDPFGATPTTEYNYLSSSNGAYYIVWSAGTSGQNQPTAISSTGDISY